MRPGRALLRRLAGASLGASAVEFALLAPVFLSFLFSIVEGGRLIWIKQSLNEVAYSAARCRSVSANCATTALTQSYAVARAAKYRMPLTASHVVVTLNTTCNGNAASNRVTVSLPFNSPLIGFIPGVPANVTAQGCFASLS